MTSHQNSWSGHGTYNVIISPIIFTSNYLNHHALSVIPHHIQALCKFLYMKHTKRPRMPCFNQRLVHHMTLVAAHAQLI